MALNSLVSGQDLCCAGELSLSRNLPQVPSPVPGGRSLQLQGSPLCLWERRTVQSSKGPRRELVVQFELDAGRLSAQ